MKKKLIIFLLLSLFIFLLTMSQQKKICPEILKNIILINYFLKYNKDFKNIISININIEKKRYILTKRRAIIQEINFLELKEGLLFDEIYLPTYRVDYNFNNIYKIEKSNIKIFPNNLKKVNEKTINKNDIDTIKSKMDKVNDDFYFEIDKLKNKYESQNRDIVKKINNYLKNCKLPVEIKNEITLVFNNEANLKNISEFLSELIVTLKENYNSENKQEKDVIFFEKMYNNIIKFENMKDLNILDILYNKKIFFDRIEVVNYELYNIEKDFSLY